MAYVAILESAMSLLSVVVNLISELAIFDKEFGQIAKDLKVIVDKLENKKPEKIA